MQNVSYKSQTSLAGVLFAVLALTASMPSPALALGSSEVPTSATTTTKTSDVGAKMLTAAKGLLGASRPSGYCQMFAEEVLTAAGNTIPKQVGASQAWDYFRSNWQKHGPCAPQPWDASKAQGGDLVFWSAGQSGSTCHKQYGHVAIYDGAGGIVENAGRGITQDKPVAYPCSTDPIGFVPMTSCNGVKNDFTQANNASNQDTPIAGQAPAAGSPSQASTSSPGGSSSPASASSSSDMMSQMMMMMMQQMMQPMQQAMSGMSQGTSSNGSGSGTGTGGGNSNGTGSSNGGSSGGSASNGSGSSNGAGSSSGDDEEDQPLLSLVEEFIDRLVSSLEELLNGTAPASGTQAASSGSGTGTQSSVMQQLQQLEEQQQAQLKNQPGASVASPTSALVSQADGTDSVRPPADPTQDWHNGRRDYRLSCARVHGAGNVEACRAAFATATE